MTKEANVQGLSAVRDPGGAAFVEAIAELARRGQNASLLTSPDGMTWIVSPDGTVTKVNDATKDPLGHFYEPPSRPIQSVVVQTTDSLCDYVNRFKNRDTVLFADIAASRIVAVIDYHTEADGDGLVKARFGDHQASLQLPHSFEWQTWKAIDGKLMGQLEFARFLEENAPDIVAPSGADLVEACRDLQARRNVNFIKAVRTSSDNEDFEYQDETRVGSKNGSVEIPTRFKLIIPVYFGRPETELFAFLRWKVEEGGGLLLGVQLNRAEQVRQAEFKLIVNGVGEATGQPVLFGKRAE